MTHPFKAAGLIYGPELHHLDHLAPLCSLMGIPLIVTEEKIAQLARRFYPKLEVICPDIFAVAEHLVTHFDIVFYSIPRDLFDEIFFFAQKMMQKKIHTIWVPHGNSDKGNAIFYMEALKKEEAALVYGKQMIDFLQSKHAYEQLKGHVLTGNYRHQFYLKHQAFYDALAEREIRLPEAEKTILYAPTWRDYERSTSFFDATAPLIDQLPEKYNLIVKLHPNLYIQDELQVQDLIDKYDSKPNVLFLNDFPAIYPVLNRADIYVGDMSSIGYDFLTFDRPMFFLNQNNQEAYLFRCGIEIKPEQYSDIHQVISRTLQFELRDFSTIRKEVYTYAFGHPKPLHQLKEEIEQLYAHFPEPGLSFF